MQNKILRDRIKKKVIYACVLALDQRVIIIYVLFISHSSLSIYFFFKFTTNSVRLTHISEIEKEIDERWRSN
jgi:hypothetical protein